MNLESKIEAILFFKNEPVFIKELAKLLGTDVASVSKSLKKLDEFYQDRGLVVISDGEYVSFGTNPEASALIESIQKEELSRELGRAGLETLAIILYKGPISRREIDHIRGVNSGFILRTLLIRGLIERTEGDTDPSGALRAGRSFTYKPTLKLLEYLGVRRIEDLPEYGTALKKLEEFVESSKSEEDDSSKE